MSHTNGCPNPDCYVAGRHEHPASAPSTSTEWIHCGKGMCVAEEGHGGTCAEASGWPKESIPSTATLREQVALTSKEQMMAKQKMTSNYTPTMELIRRDYLDAIRDREYMDLYTAEFDRGLAEHDRAIAEKAWDDGARQGFLNIHHAKVLPSGETVYAQMPQGNPHRPVSALLVPTEDKSHE